MYYRIGLDIGIASVGSCVMMTNECGEPIKILELNSRIFDTAEHPKDGASLAEPRRTARGLRRRIRRKAHRLERAKKLFKDLGLDINPNPNVNFIRVKALDEYVCEDDFAIVLLLLIKRRGFKSNRIHDKKGDNGLLLSATEANEKLMAEKGYRTVGEMLYREYAKTISCKNGEIEICNTRNEAGKYTKTVLRSDIEEEIVALFESQKRFGNKIATDEIRDKVLELLNNQRNFDEGPGKGSIYSASFKIGTCQFEKNELRAPKASYSFERAIALQKLNNLFILNGSDERPLTPIERTTLLSLIDKHKEVKFSQIRKALSIDNGLLFNLANYNISARQKNKDGTITVLSADEIIKKAESAIFISTKNSKEIAVCLAENNGADTKLIDKIAAVLTTAKSDSKRAKMFETDDFRCLSDIEKAKLLALNYAKYGHLSFKALGNILPYLEEGQKYSDACISAGYNHSQNTGEKTKLLNTKEIHDAVNDITSPVVKRSISQTIKVINAIIRKYGSPLAINVELARDMSKSREERDKDDRENKKRFEINQKAKEELSDKFGITAKSLDLIKYRLYEEQNGKCIYSGTAIDINRLFEPNYVQIDHIIPYSRSFDDSFKNKVLVLASENQNKGNRTPFEYLFTTEKWNDYVTIVNALYSNNFKKKAQLLKEDFSENEWKSRAINDTRYISRYLLNMLQNNLVFEEGKMTQKRVFSVSGGITSQVRRQWGIAKVREDGDIHHAVDACVIACVTDGIIQKLTRAYIKKETNEKDKIVSTPYENFVNELESRCMSNKEEMAMWLLGIGYSDEELADVNPIFVSRMPDRKSKGEIHQKTIRSDKFKEQNIVVSKTALTKLKLDADGEIENYFNPESDLPTYNVLKTRLKQFNGNAELAFVEPIYKPKKNGLSGNEIKKVKLVDKRNSGFELKKVKGFANNGDMVRVDIFEKGNKFYGVPVYTKDIYAKTLPNRAATQGKMFDNWDIMDETYNFKFSLYKNDLIKVKHKRGITMAKQKNAGDSKMPDAYSFVEDLLYFKSFDISTGSCLVITHNNCYGARIGIKTLESLEKYQVDVLGNVSRVKKEQRIL